MTDIPADILATAKAAFDEMDQIPYDDFYEERAERIFARAILAERERDRWQPIETAPKDGTKFWGDDGCDAIALFWHEGFGEFVSSFRRMEMAPGYTIDGEASKDHSPVVHRPSWWMPIIRTPSTPKRADT